MTTGPWDPVSLQLSRSTRLLSHIRVAILRGYILDGLVSLLIRRGICIVRNTAKHVCAAIVRLEYLLYNIIRPIYAIFIASIVSFTAAPQRRTYSTYELENKRER